MIKTDFHLHTTLSVDASAEIDTLVESAIQRGLTEIAITDHVDYNPADEGANLYNPAQSYEMIVAARQKYKDKIILRHGVELSEPHLYTDETKEIYQTPLDVVIGSIHYVGRFGVHADYYDEYGPRTAAQKYFEPLLDMVRTSDIDILGHLDYFDRYASLRGLPVYDPQDYELQIKTILDTIIQRNIALEINTSGWRAPVNHCFPHPEVIRWYYRMGGRLISIGSDGHHAKDIGEGLDHAGKLLNDMGFREYHIFRERKPIALAI